MTHASGINVIVVYNIQFAQTKLADALITITKYIT